MNSPTSVHLVEAVPFASRLHVLQPLAAGAAMVAESVTVHVPRRVGGVDWDRFNEDKPAGVRIVHSNGSQIARPREKVSLTRVFRLVSRALSRGEEQRRVVVLTAIDDYPFSLPILALRLAMRPAWVRVVFVRYRVDDFRQVAPRPTMRQRVKRWYFATMAYMARASTVVFDERIPTTDGRNVLPDPWSGAFGTASRPEARGALDWHPSAPYVGLIGYQDARKGFTTACDLLTSARALRPDLRAVIVGKVDDVYEEQLAQLRNVFGSDLVHFEAYVEDDYLARVMSALDSVLLPYSASFTSTSGVLARCAASRTPVLATDHGLVAWRIKRYGLGGVFSRDDIPAGAEQLLGLLAGYEQPSAASEFAERSSAPSVARRFSEILASVAAR